MLECYVRDDSVDGFLQESATSGGRGEELAAAGGVGTLRATVVAAQDLRNADLLSLSDPYAELRLGLQNRRTPTVKDLITALIVLVVLLLLLLPFLFHPVVARP